MEPRPAAEGRRRTCPTVDPELSNLNIFTAVLGFRPSDKFSADFVYHYYLQHTVADELRESALELEPNQDGSRQSRHLGSEFDIVFGFREIFGVEDLAVDLALGYFLPGRAYRVAVDEDAKIFKDADAALLVRFDITYEF